MWERFGSLKNEIKIKLTCSKMYMNKSSKKKILTAQRTTEMNELFLWSVTWMYVRRVLPKCVDTDSVYIYFGILQPYIDWRWLFSSWNRATSPNDAYNE